MRNKGILVAIIIAAMKIAVIISYYIFKICGISINRALNIAAKNITKKNSGYIYIYQDIYIYIYMYIYIRSICRQQLFRSLRAHQYSSDQMKILKDQSAQTTARVVRVAYRLWLPFLINRVRNLTKLRSVI